MLSWIQKYKKISFEECSNEKFEMKSYFKTMTIDRSRLFFKVQVSMTPTIRLSYKSNKKFRAEKWVCTDCMSDNPSVNQSVSEEEKVTVTISSRTYTGFPDSNQHQMLHCRANEDLRKGKNVMENENDCVEFFQQLIQRRMDKLT